MKFIVDELPTRPSECPFITHGIECKISGIECPHFAYDDGCDHLLPAKKLGQVVTVLIDKAQLMPGVDEKFQIDVRGLRV